MMTDFLRAESHAASYPRVRRAWQKLSAHFPQTRRQRCQAVYDAMTLQPCARCQRLIDPNDDICIACVCQDLNWVLDQLTKWSS